jgi:hypothetical protein
MKKIVLYSLISTLFLSKSFAQEAGEPKKQGWPSVERYAFITECIKTAKVSLSEDSARYYCYCMQEKIEKKYPLIEEAGKITAADMQSPEWKKDIQSCITGASTWSSKDRSGFLEECVGAAKDGMSEQKAKGYCECMLFKIEKKYPNPNDAAGITEETMKSPEWKKMVQDCLDF